MPLRNPSKYRTHMKRKRQAYALRSTKRQRTARPARQQVSLAKYRRNKMISRAISQVAETQQIATKQIDEFQPVPIQVGALAYMQMIRTGPNIANDPTSGLAGVDGFTTTQGVSGSGERTGNYIYLKKTHLTVEVEMNANDTVKVPCNFRTIVFKRRRNANLASNLPVFQKDLFLQNNGQTVGHSTSGLNGSDLILQPVNKKDYIVFSDKKYTMTPLAFHKDNANAGFFNSKYTSYKKFVYNLPHFKKTHYDNNTNNPDDYDCNWYVVTYAKPLGKDSTAIGWEVNCRGTTTFTDM